jgi:hypothetical protein
MHAQDIETCWRKYACVSKHAAQAFPAGIYMNECVGALHDMVEKIAFAAVSVSFGH